MGRWQAELRGATLDKSWRSYLITFAVIFPIILVVDGLIFGEVTIRLVSRTIGTAMGWTALYRWWGPMIARELRGGREKGEKPASKTRRA